MTSEVCATKGHQCDFSRAALGFRLEFKQRNSCLEPKISLKDFLSMILLPVTSYLQMWYIESQSNDLLQDSRVRHA